MKINTYSYVENPKVSANFFLHVEPTKKGAQSVSEALSQRHFIMAAALIAPKIGSAGTDLRHNCYHLVENASPIQKNIFMATVSPKLAML